MKTHLRSHIMIYVFKTPNQMYIYTFGAVSKWLSVNFNTTRYYYILTMLDSS